MRITDLLDGRSVSLTAAPGSRLHYCRGRCTGSHGSFRRQKTDRMSDF